MVTPVISKKNYTRIRLTAWGLWIAVAVFYGGGVAHDYVLILNAPTIAPQKVKLLNVKTKLIEDLDESQVTPAVAAGTHAFQRRTRVPVITPDGTVRKIVAEGAPRAFKQGYRFAGEFTQQKRKIGKGFFVFAVGAFDNPAPHFAGVAAWLLIPVPLFWLKKRYFHLLVHDEK